MENTNDFIRWNNDEYQYTNEPVFTKKGFAQLIKHDRQKNQGGRYFWHHGQRDVMALDEEDQYCEYVDTLKNLGCSLVRVKELNEEEVKSLGILRGCLEIWRCQDENGETKSLSIPTDPVSVFCGFMNGTAEFTILRVNKYCETL